MAEFLLESDRLSLRHISLDDAPRLHELMGEPSYRRFLSSLPRRSLEEVRELIRTGFIESYERLGFGFYVVERSRDSEFLGICGLVKRDSLPEVDIGYGFLRRHWSRGYALEAAQAVVEHARRDLGLKRLLAATHPENSASAKLLVSLGMSLEGRVEIVEGADEDDLYGMQL